MPTTPGFGVSVALFGETAFVIDSVQGQVRQLDPRSLAPVGDAITLPNGIAPGGFDGKGTLWVAVPTEGTVVAITPGALTAPARCQPATVDRTVPHPGHDLVLSHTGRRRRRARQHRPGAEHRQGRQGRPRRRSRSTSRPSCRPAARGDSVPVTVAERPLRSSSSTAPRLTTSPSRAPAPSRPAVYLRRPRLLRRRGCRHRLRVRRQGKLLNQITIPAPGGPLELEVRENHLFINAPDGSTARVVDDNHVVKDVNKYQDGVLGADPPPPPPQAQDAEAGQGRARQAAERHRVRRATPSVRRHLAQGPRQRRAHHQVRRRGRRPDDHRRRQPALGRRSKA